MERLCVRRYTEAKSKVSRAPAGSKPALALAMDSNQADVGNALFKQNLIPEFELGEAEADPAGDGCAGEEGASNATSHWLPCRSRSPVGSPKRAHGLLTVGHDRLGVDAVLDRVRARAEADARVDLI